MNKQALIVELITEELPPKALQNLGDAFAGAIIKILLENKLIDNNQQYLAFATPRRLAVYIESVLGQAADQKFTEKLMPAKIGIDDQGNASAALSKKLSAKSLDHLQVKDLVIRNDGKQDMLYAEGMASGATLKDALQTAIEYAITHLPIPKVMQYQLANGESVKFVRPAHKLVAMWGHTVVPVNALGLTATNISMGHRFMGPNHIQIESAESWQAQISQTGKIIPLFDERRKIILEQLTNAANKLGASIGDAPETKALLDEVTALVEHPTVYVGEFESKFLAIPPECLILTMRLNQKYFPLFDPRSGKLSNKFLIVSNMDLSNPQNIIQGNEKVIRPRLADAEFFYETDLKQPLANRVAGLAKSIYHNKLGNGLERTERIQKIAQWLAPLIGADIDKANRAAWLAHADLSTLMVGEFPELQGVMGAYYAEHDGEPKDVVIALKNQYAIRINQAITEQDLVSVALFMAIRAETLIGIWGIGLAPTGERDPYGLRRAALGLISAYEELCKANWINPNQESPANLKALLNTAFNSFAVDLDGDTINQVLNFVFERYRNQLSKQFEHHLTDAVLATKPPIHQVYKRIQACQTFLELPEATALASANKRISNILKKADLISYDIDSKLLTEPAEIELAKMISTLAPIANQALKEGDFQKSLAVLAGAKDSVDEFFANVMVMDKDPAVQQNRLALLHSLHQLMQQIADISRLAQ